MSIKHARKRRVARRKSDRVPRKHAPKAPRIRPATDVRVFLKENAKCGTGQELEDRISAYLLRLGIFHENRTVGKFRAPSGNRVQVGIVGESDIVAYLQRPGGGNDVLRVECKEGSGKQSDEQAWYQAIIESTGQYYIIARSEKDVSDWLVSHGYLPPAAEQLSLSPESAKKCCC